MNDHLGLRVPIRPVGLALRAVACAALGLGLAACTKPPPPAAPAPPPPKPVPIAIDTSQPAPPPPKCESLAEKCAAAADTKLDVGAKGAWFTPPLGWTYARETDRSIALSPDGNAALVLTLAPGTKPDEITTAVEGLLVRLEVQKIKLPSLKKRLDKPESTLPVDGQEVRLWEVDKRRQDGQNPEMKTKPGVALIALAPFADQPIVAAGFVVKPEGEAHAATVMQSVQTLRAKR
jgi:hypothetical protein